MPWKKDLVELGLLAKGDRIKLKSFCKKGISSDREGKMARIKQIRGQGKGKKLGDPTFSAAVGSTSSGNSARTSSLKYKVGWKHWKPGRGYVQMKKNTGGGTRTVHIPRNASLEECQTIAEGLFFPEGKSSVGELEKMITAMGNFSGDCIVLMREDGKPFQFSPERYKEMTGLTVPRLYLLTKNEDDADGDEDESFPSAFGYHDPSFGTKRASSPSFPKEDGLIGTSSERQQFFDDLDQELRASLAADKAKVKSTNKQQLISEPTNDETDSLERLRQVREQRSLPEPDSSEPKVKVSVRHCTLGVVSRVFDPEGSMQGVYDWIGSLSRTPEHFFLVTFPSTTLYPDEKVVKVNDTVINTTETTEPVPLSKDEEDVYFQDGWGLEHGFDDTVWDENEFCSPQSPRQQGLPVIATHSTNEIDPVNINPPVHLLANEDNPKSDNKLSLEEKVQLQESKLQPAKIVIIDRHDAVNELSALYSDKDILDCKLSVSFADENALGDGTLREVYSLFWDSFVARFCEGSRQFAVIPNPSLSDENYQALGRIITHQLVLTGTFPIQLAEV
ncbi:unnamed protein product [Porites evermanni]|uniref:Uncharacterized protein n=1 Tax=Porites evermanni TaxID=104178 RepID=A0ABN8T088_9CNID|nr:unnamed protein product [Porites evermanni]